MESGSFGCWRRLRDSTDRRSGKDLAYDRLIRSDRSLMGSIGSSTGACLRESEGRRLSHSLSLSLWIRGNRRWRPVGGELRIGVCDWVAAWWRSGAGRRREEGKLRATGSSIWKRTKAEASFGLVLTPAETGARDKLLSRDLRDKMRTQRDSCGISARFRGFRRGTSMERILERYMRYSYVDKALPIKEPESQEDLRHEYEELKRKVDALQRSRRPLMGENLDTLSLTELQQLELQLETTLKHIRSQMNQLLLDSIAELQGKEKSLLENKIVLENKIIENNNAITMAQQMQEKQQGRDQASFSTPPTLLLINSLSTTLPSWMLRPPS